MSKDIVERLRATTEEMAHKAGVTMTLWDRHSNACLEAADEIEWLQAERDEARAEAERLREALAPFAALALVDEQWFGSQQHMAILRRARAAYEENKG